jgi:cell wall-associated NlpC family hydrolase
VKGFTQSLVNDGFSIYVKVFLGSAPKLNKPKGEVVMNNTKKSRIGKKLMGIILSLSIAFSGGLLLTPQSAHAATVSSSSVADNVIATGKQFLGVPYKFGAKSGRTDAFDCSSFTQYVFKKNGINIPRSSRQQAKVGTFVPRNQLKPGDLVFSDTNRDGIINHVSIYMGNGKLLHTYRVGVGVTISNFAGSTWDRTYVTARRVI